MARATGSSRNRNRTRLAQFADRPTIRDSEKDSVHAVGASAPESPAPGPPPCAVPTGGGHGNQEETGGTTEGQSGGRRTLGLATLRATRLQARGPDGRSSEAGLAHPRVGRERKRAKSVLRSLRRCRRSLPLLHPGSAGGLRSGDSLRVEGYGAPVRRRIRRPYQLNRSPVPGLRKLCGPPGRSGASGGDQFR